MIIINKRWIYFWCKIIPFILLSAYKIKLRRKTYNKLRGFHYNRLIAIDYFLKCLKNK